MLANFNIPRPYSAKREFLNKINELRQKQKEKAEAERKETTLKTLRTVYLIIELITARNLLVNSREIRKKKNVKKK